MDDSIEKRAGDNGEVIIREMQDHASKTTADIGEKFVESKIVHEENSERQQR